MERRQLGRRQLGGGQLAKDGALGGIGGARGYGFSARRRDGGLRLRQAALRFGVGPDVDLGRLGAQRRQRRADLAPVVGPVVEGLGQPHAPVAPGCPIRRRDAGPRPVPGPDRRPRPPPTSRRSRPSPRAGPRGPSWTRRSARPRRPSAGRGRTDRNRPSGAGCRGSGRTCPERSSRAALAGGPRRRQSRPGSPTRGARRRRPAAVCSCGHPSIANRQVVTRIGAHRGCARDYGWGLMNAPPTGDDKERFWHDYLTRGDAMERRVRRLFRVLPHGPRCQLCAAPFAGAVDAGRCGR